MSFPLHAPYGLNEGLNDWVWRGRSGEQMRGSYEKNSMQLYRLEKATKLFQVDVGNFETSAFHECLFAHQPRLKHVIQE
jgi:hypothetical protein